MRSELGKKRLAEIAPLFVGYNNIIEIRGHTADATFAPANDPLGGNAWDVGYERARNTMAYLIDDCGLDRKRFRITTAADTEPLDRRNPAANRRVEIIMTDRLSTEDR